MNSDEKYLAAAKGYTTRMRARKGMPVNSPIGRRKIDSTGSAVGVVRMDANKSYAGIGELLQDYINRSDQGAWETIKAKIDYTYENLDLALAPLDAETGFGDKIKSSIEKGQKLLFKPNLVGVLNIDPETHGPAFGSTACTEWPFVAALMRWFHDKLDISYHQMALGEAASAMPAAAGLFSMLNPEGKPVTTEAAIEGKAGDFYGGWGFYFVRKYLAETHDPSHSDDPLKGYDESVAGTYIPPGHVSDKLLVYDLNRIFDDVTKGRNVEVPDGANFSSITLHKAVVGGDPGDSEDMNAYPGSVLVNVPKLKVHALTLFTNVIKNLGIGLYPMQVAEGSGAKDFRWKYSTPHTAIPGIKAGIPHQVWVPEMDLETSLPRRNTAGKYIVKKTGGLPGTMVDIIKAVSSQGVFMLHIVDAIEAINLDHQGLLPGTKEAEGMVFAGLDPVATDLMCARYMFKNVPIQEARKVPLDDGTGGHFLQRVPVPTVEGNNIVTRTGYDCPLSRDISFRYAEKRGLGRRQYYVEGRDAVADCPLVSLQGHLGRVSDGTFSDLTTGTLYFDAYKMPWDMQETALKYLEAVDKLADSSLKKEFLEAFDENGDGIVSYEEFGKQGITGPMLVRLGSLISMMGTEEFGYLRGSFTMNATMLKYSNEMWNPDGHNLLKELFYGVACFVAYNMSQMELESQDPFLPSLTWGKGKWPSYQLASYVYIGFSLYGREFPFKFGFPSLYGTVFLYADLTQNEGRYTGRIRSQPDPEAAHRYVTEVLSGKAKPLDFTLYVPGGYGSVGGSNVPNVEETSDPEKIFTAVFAGGKEVWPGTRPKA
jgi:hypothetical protein